MKKLVYAFFILGLCACTPEPLNLQQVQMMDDYSLCAWPRYEPFIPGELARRGVNCAQVVRDYVAQSVRVANVSQLCDVWYNRAAGQNMDLVDNEVARRRVDCAGVYQQNQQLQLLREQNAIQAQRNQLLDSPPPPQHTRCRTVGNETRCTAY